jgi:hypothetical protein
MPDPRAQFDADLKAARDRSIATLRKAADHRRVEILARNIHASLQGESIANATLALTKVLGVSMRSRPHDEQITGIAIVATLITQALLGDDA